MRLICAFETNFFISKVGIIALDGGGFEQGVQRIRRTLAPLFSSVFCLIISELLGEFFLRKKKRMESKNCQNGIHSFKSCYAECNFDSLYLEQNSTNGKGFL